VQQVIAAGFKGADVREELSRRRIAAIEEGLIGARPA